MLSSQTGGASPPTDVAVKRVHGGWKVGSVYSQSDAVAPVPEIVSVITILSVAELPAGVCVMGCEVVLVSIFVVESDDEGVAADLDSDAVFLSVSVGVTISERVEMAEGDEVAAVEVTDWDIEQEEV